MAAGESFDLGKVADHLEAAMGSGATEDVRLADYVEAHREFNRLFAKLGILWGFIHRDVAAKLDRLDPVVKGAPGALVGPALLEPAAAAPPSDSPTVALIRIHRASEFIVRIMSDVFAAADDANLQPIVRAAYDETLGPFHSRLVRQAVHIAMKTVGSRRDLAPIVFSGRSREAARPIVARLVAAAAAVRARNQRRIKANPALANLK